MQSRFVRFFALLSAAAGFGALAQTPLPIPTPPLPPVTTQPAATATTGAAQELTYPLLLQPPRTPEETEERRKLARERLEALAPTTQSTTQPEDELTQRLFDARRELYQEWTAYLAQLQRMTALRESLKALSSEQRVQELSQQIDALKNAAQELQAQPAPDSATEAQVTQVEALLKEYQGRAEALSQEQTRRSNQLATGFKQQREALQAELARLRQRRQELLTQVGGAPTTAPAAQELQDLQRRIVDVQIARQEVTLTLLALEVEETELRYKQDQRLTEALAQYNNMLQERMRALQAARSRSALEVLELRRQRTTDPRELALIDLQIFREKALVYYFKNQKLLKEIGDRFPQRELDLLLERINASAAIWLQALETKAVETTAEPAEEEEAADRKLTPALALAYRTGQDVMDLRLEIREREEEFEAELLDLQKKLTKATTQLYEIKSARDRGRERFRALEALVLEGIDAVSAAERTRLETEISQLRKSLEEVFESTIAQAEEVVLRLRIAVQRLEEHLDLLLDAENALYRSALGRRESGLPGLNWPAIWAELQQLFGISTPHAAQLDDGTPSLDRAGIAEEMPEAREAVVESAYMVLEQLDPLIANWIFVVMAVVVAIALGIYIRRIAVQRARRAFARLTVEAPPPDPQTGEQPRQFHDRMNLLGWELVADLVIPAAILGSLWLAAFWADVPIETRLPAYYLFGLGFLGYAALNLITRLFDVHSRRRIVRSSDAVAWHYRFWGRTVMIIFILCVPPIMMLYEFGLLGATRTLLWEVWKTAFLLALVGFLLRSQRVVQVGDQANRRAWAQILFSALQPLLLVIVVVLLVLECVGYGLLVEYVGGGILASAAVIVGILVVVEYLCDLLEASLRYMTHAELIRRAWSHRVAGSGAKRIVSRATHQPGTGLPLPAAKPEPEDRSQTASRFMLQLLQTVLRIAGLAAAFLLVLQIWGLRGLEEQIAWKSVITGAIVIAIALLLDRVIVSALGALELANRLPHSTANLIRRWGRILLTALVGLILLALTGMPVGMLWAPLSALFAMIAVGFVAVWSLLSNMLATIIILIWRPFNIGEQVEVRPEGISGRVIDINFLYTLLKSDGDAQIVVPNSLFIQKFLIRQRLRGTPTRSLAEQLTAEKPAGS